MEYWGDSVSAICEQLRLGVGPVGQASPNLIARYAGDLERLLSAGRAGDEGDLRFPHAQPTSEELDAGFVRSTLDGRSGELDRKHVALPAGDLVSRAAGIYTNFEECHVRISFRLVCGRFPQPLRSRTSARISRTVRPLGRACLPGRRARRHRLELRPRTRSAARRTGR